MKKSYFLSLLATAAFISGTVYYQTAPAFAEGTTSVVTEDENTGGEVAEGEDTGTPVSTEVSEEVTFNSAVPGVNSVAKVLIDAEATAEGDVKTVIDNLNTLESKEEVEKALAQMTADSNGAVVAASIKGQEATFNVVNSRQNAVRADNHSAERGLPAGDNASGTGTWVQGFGNRVEQDARDNVDGYKSKTAGGTVGIDKTIENTTVGVAYSHAKTDIDLKGAKSGNETEVTTHQGTLYGSYDLDKWYVDGQASVGFNDYESKRAIQFADIDRVAAAEYDGLQYGGKVTGGYRYGINNVELTPELGVQYSHLNIDSYQETGADSLNLQSEEQDYDILQSVLGAKVAYPVEMANVTVVPNAHATWLYDFIGDRQQVASTFIGHVVPNSAASPQRHSGIVGLGMDIMSKADVTLSLGYDLELKDEYQGHAGSVKLKYNF